MILLIVLVCIKVLLCFVYQNLIAAFFLCIYIVLFCLYVRPLGPENLLLRGARLKNTKEIYGESIQLAVDDTVEREALRG